MTYRLSILDKSPAAPGHSGEEALAASLAYADFAERLDFHRFWLAEHHGFKLMASPAPEILAAHILARTDRSRVGTGGVLLQHYAPYKVAETFAMLAALAPGRVDLGIGRAPGGYPLNTAALQAELAEARTPFRDKVAAVDAFPNGDAPDRHAGAEVRPRPAVPPDCFLLGSSEDAARSAAALGWGFVYPGHQDGEPAAIDRSLAAFGSAGPRPILAVVAFAAATRTEAEAVVQWRSFKAVFPDGFSVNLGSTDAVAEYARHLGAEPLRVEEQQPQILCGTPDDVHAGLAWLADRHGVDDFIIDCPVAERTARLRSIKLLATARCQLSRLPKVRR